MPGGRLPSSRGTRRRRRGRRLRRDGPRHRAAARAGRADRAAVRRRGGRRGGGARRDRRRPGPAGRARKAGGHRRNRRQRRGFSRWTRSSQLAGATLVVEAVIEDLEAKRRLFAELEPIVGEQAILATNTSSLSVAAIAAACAPARARRRLPLLQPGAGHEGRRGDRRRCARTPPSATRSPSSRERFGHVARARARHAGLHRQPRRPRLRDRGPQDPRRRRLRTGGARRRACATPVDSSSAPASCSI